jgi:hypothetical protein
MARRCFALNGMPILGAALIVSTAYAAADDHANGSGQQLVACLVLVIFCSSTVV